MFNCRNKTAMFICCVDKLRSNYDTLQPHILMNLIEFDCCSFLLCYVMEI